MTTQSENQAAKNCLALANQQIAEVDAQLQEIVEKLVAGTINTTLARVQEINLLRRREQYEKIANAARGSIKHF